MIGSNVKPGGNVNAMYGPTQATFLLCIPKHFPQYNNLPFLNHCSSAIKKQHPYIYRPKKQNGIYRSRLYCYYLFVRRFPFKEIFNTSRFDNANYLSLVTPLPYK